MKNAYYRIMHGNHLQQGNTFQTAQTILLPKSKSNKDTKVSNRIKMTMSALKTYIYGYIDGKKLEFLDETLFKFTYLFFYLFFFFFL